MVWAGFGNGYKAHFAFPAGRMKANDYQDLLDTHLLPFGEAIGGPFWFFSKTMLLFLLQTPPENEFCRMGYT